MYWTSAAPVSTAVMDADAIAVDQIVDEETNVTDLPRRPLRGDRSGRRRRDPERSLGHSGRRPRRDTGLEVEADAETETLLDTVCGSTDTRTGDPCQQRVADGGRCRFHRDDADETSDGPAVTTPVGATADAVAEVAVADGGARTADSDAASNADDATAIVTDDGDASSSSHRRSRVRVTRPSW